MDIPEIVKNKEQVLLLVNPTELCEFAENLANRIMAATPKPLPELREEKLLTQPEAIKFLRKSRQTLIKWRSKNIVTSYRLGGRIYYKQSELISALEKLTDQNKSNQK